MILQSLVAGLSGFAVSLLIAFVVCFCAPPSALLDVPNHRSSHIHPTPRGGGLGILIPVLVVLCFGTAESDALWSITTGVGVTAVAFVGLLDDLHHLEIRLRLVVHLVGAIIFASAAVALSVPTTQSALLLASVFSWWVFWGVSLINVVNFIDGIDTLVGLQALVFGGFTYLAVDGQGLVGLTAITMTGASVGFLVLNRSPARIFLGDVGSGGLGLLFGFLGVATMVYAGWSVFHAFLPLMAMFADELVTVTRRVRRGERLTEPHRSHVYQHLTSRGWRHGTVALGYAVHSVVSVGVAVLFPALDICFLVVAGTLLALTLLGMWSVVSVLDQYKTASEHDLSRDPSE